MKQPQPAPQSTISTCPKITSHPKCHNPFCANIQRGINCRAFFRAQKSLSWHSDLTMANHSQWQNSNLGLTQPKIMITIRVTQAQFTVATCYPRPYRFHLFKVRNFQKELAPNSGTERTVMCGTVSLAQLNNNLGLKQMCHK